MFHLLLNVVHHRYGRNQNGGRNYLMRVKTGVEKTPGDADCGEHHFEVTGCGCAGEMQPLKINQERNPAEIEARKNNNTMAFIGCACAGSGQSAAPFSFP